MTSVFPRRKLAEAVTEVKRARAAGVREGASKWGRDGCRQALGGACRGRLSILPDLGVSRWPNRCEWPKGVMDRDLNGSGPFLIGRCLALSFSSFSPLPPLSVVAAVTAVHAVHDGHQRSSHILTVTRCRLSPFFSLITTSWHSRAASYLTSLYHLHYRHTS